MNAKIEHETDAVEHHFVGEQEAGFQIDIPIGLGDFVGVVVNQFDSKSQPVALSDLEHKVGSQVMDKEIFVCAILLAHVFDAQCILIICDEMPLAVKFKEVGFRAQFLVDVLFGWCQIPR